EIACGGLHCDRLAGIFHHVDGFDVSWGLGRLVAFDGLARTGFRSTKQRFTGLQINARVAVGANASESCFRTLRGTLIGR
ncbi:unnamed protein product, partial [Ectocarpus sp. 12 AP-2014]